MTEENTITTTEPTEKVELTEAALDALYDEIVFTAVKVRQTPNGFAATGEAWEGISRFKTYDFALGATEKEARVNYDLKTKKIAVLTANFVELDRQKKDHKKFYEDLDAATGALCDIIGLNQLFQDDQGIVYKTEKPSGTFVAFKDVAISRTRREADGEAKGTLSMKEAEAAGFILPEKIKK